MKKPQWLVEEVARHGQLVLDGNITAAVALAALSAQITGHGEYVAGLISVDAKRELSAWLSENRVDEQPFQADMFPDLPRRLRVTPGKYVEVAAMNGHHLDMARNILWAKTQNAMDGAKAAAEHERDIFTTFYEKVRPMLAGDLTVGDVLDELRQAV